MTPASDWPLALTVACPTCAARAGRKCTDDNVPYYPPMWEPHAARLRAAREKGERDAE